MRFSNITKYLKCYLDLRIGSSECRNIEYTQYTFILLKYLLSIYIHTHETNKKRKETKLTGTL